MRSTPAVLVLCGVLVAGHVAGVVRDDPVLARGAGAAALAVLAVWAFVVARSGRFPLAAGLGVLAVATGAGYAWDVPRARATEIAWFSYSPLGSGIPGPDMAPFRWTGTATLVGYALIAIGAMRLPRRASSPEPVVVAALISVLLLGYGVLSVLTGSRPSAAAAAEALPSLLAAAAVLCAWVLSARRTGYDAFLVWAGLAMLAVPALRGAIATADFAAFAEHVRAAAVGVTGDLNAVSSIVLPYAGWSAYALDAFFAGLRVLGAAIVTLGVIRCARSVSV